MCQAFPKVALIIPIHLYSPNQLLSFRVQRLRSGLESFLITGIDLSFHNVILSLRRIPLFVYYINHPEIKKPASNFSGRLHEEIVIIKLNPATTYFLGPRPASKRLVLGLTSLFGMEAL
jgi:hypothetical protein